MKSLFKKIKNESGQSAIEYVLVLTVVVGVVLGGLYQLNTAFRVFADAYFGDYLACLLETGELPALDRQVTSNDPAFSCNASFQSFNLANGKQLVNMPAQSPGSGSSGPGSPKAGGFNSTAAAAAAANSARGKANTFSIGRSSLPPPPITRFAVARGAGAKDSGSNTGDISATDVQGYQGAKVIRIHVRRDVEGYRGEGFGQGEEKEKQTVKVSQSAQTLAEQKRKELIRVERKPAAVKTTDIDEFTFGNFLRYLIIAAIVIAILFFLGSQAMQVSKSMD